MGSKFTIMKRAHVAAVVFAAFVIGVLSFSGDPAHSESRKINAFERFRTEMMLTPGTAAPAFMRPEALERWNRTVRPYFVKNIDELKDFFALSVIVARIRKPDMYLFYFNPWVDGVLLTRWKERGGGWKIEDIYLASGERVRGQDVSQAAITRSNLTPVWLLLKGTFIRNIVSYFKDMRARLMNGNIKSFLSWFSLQDVDSRADLLRVKLRVYARTIENAGYLSKSGIGPVLTGAISRLKNDALARNKKKLAGYSRHADMLGSLRPDIIKSLRVDWVFHDNGVFSVVLTPPVFPRLFIFLNVNRSGKTETALLGDLESMATMLQPAASTMRYTRTAQPTKPPPPSRKVQNYKDAKGNMVEIITEKRGGKVTMTTRINGVITEVLTF